MITINVKTWAVTNAREHKPQVIEPIWGYNVTNGYIRGWVGPNYPMPAIRYDVEIMPNRVILWTKWSNRIWDMRYMFQDYSLN